jgi:uncharacterized SAM-binding protein YcdF (DUF218 family)
MSALIQLVFSVEGVIAALVVGTAWVIARPRSAIARGFLAAASVFYAVASIYVVPAFIGSLLTRGYHPFVSGDAVAAPTAIVVLGSGAETVRGWEGGRTGVPGGDSAARVLEASRIARELPSAIIISSGGPSPTEPDQIPVAVVMRDELIALGVPPARVLLEAESRDTHDEAMVLDPMMRARNIRQIVLVTSDLHMRRSVGTFERRGWKVVPAIAPNPNFDTPLGRRIVPSGMGLAYSSAVMHEVIGIPYYWLRGWWR